MLSYRKGPLIGFVCLNDRTSREGAGEYAEDAPVCDNSFMVNGRTGFSDQMNPENR